jgi:hypothetical protein
VEGQQSAKNFRTLTKNLKNAPLKPGAAIEREHQSRHKQWPQGQAAVRGLVAGEIAGPKTVSQRSGLAESKAETFAGDRIDRTRSIADQRNISSPDTPQFAIRRYCAPFGRNRLRTVKPGVEFGQSVQRFFQAKLGFM